MIQNYNLESGKVNNDYFPVHFDLNPAAYNELTDAEILMQVRHAANGAIIKEYKQGAGITVSPPYRFTMDKQTIDIPAGDYLYDYFIKFKTVPWQMTVVGGQWHIDEVISKE
jgi:hypothetical protein